MSSVETGRNILFFPSGNDSTFPKLFPGDTLYFISESGEGTRNVPELKLDLNKAQELRNIQSASNTSRSRLDQKTLESHAEGGEIVSDSEDVIQSARTHSSSSLRSTINTNTSSIPIGNINGSTSDIQNVANDNYTSESNCVNASNIPEVSNTVEVTEATEIKEAIIRYVSPNHLQSLLHKMHAIIINCVFLKESDEEKYTFIRYILKIVEKSQESTHPWKGKIILLSNLLSWAKSIDVDGNGVFSDLEAVCRIPSPAAEKQYQIEKIVSRMNSIYEDIHAHIVFSGLWYGNGEFLLQGLYKQAREARQSISLPAFASQGFDQASNILPTIHVNDLGIIIKSLVYWNLETHFADGTTITTLNKEDPPLYLLAVDTKLESQFNIIRSISNSYYHLDPEIISPTSTKALLFEYYHQFTLHLPSETSEWIRNLTINWHALNIGPVEFANDLKKEFEETRNLKPLRIVIIGPPYVGKSATSLILSSFYKIPHLNIKNVLNEFFGQVEIIEQKLAEIGVDPKAFLQDYQQQQAKKKGESVPIQDPNPISLDLKKKLIELEELKLDVEVNQDSKGKAPPKGKTPISTNNAPPRYTDRVLIAAFKWKIDQLECKNHGWILDGFPKTVSQVTELFCFPAPEIPIDPKTKKPKVPVEPEEPRLANKELLPHFLISLHVDNDTLLKKNFSKSVITQNTSSDTDPEARYSRRIAFYNKNNEQFAILEANQESAQYQASSDQDVFSAFNKLSTTKSSSTQNADIEENIDSSQKRKSEVVSILVDLSDSNDEYDAIRKSSQLSYSTIGDTHTFSHTSQLSTIQSSSFIEHLDQWIETFTHTSNENSDFNTGNDDSIINQSFEHNSSFHEDPSPNKDNIDNDEYNKELEVLDKCADPLKNRFASEILPAITKAILELCQTRPEDPLHVLSEKLIQAGLDYA